MEWIKNSVIYNIYPLGFCGAPRENDGIQTYRLDKLYDWIDHLKELHINALVFNPVFESSRHGYDTKDYFNIDKRLGDNESFKRLCDTLHSNGIRVILDGVFNHVGRDFWAFRDVIEHKQASPYCLWFHNLNFGGSSPYGDPFWYEGWSGNYDLVKLNLYNEDVVQHLLSAVEFWIKEFDIDGLRLDAADCIDMNFFLRLKQKCRELKPDFWLYGEIIHGDYNRWANPEMLDSVTNYECYKGIYSSHNDKNYFEIAHSLRRQFENGGIYKNIYTYNFVDNHDVNRIRSVLRNKRHVCNVYTLLYTMPGVPSVYYGSEWAIEGTRTRESDVDLRPCLDINNIPNADNELNSHLKKLGNIRRSLCALADGSFENRTIRNEQLVYRRFNSQQQVYVMLNLSEEAKDVDFRVDGSGFLTDVLNGNCRFEVNGFANISVPPCSARILVLNDGDFKLPGETEESEAEFSELKTEDSPAPLPVRPCIYRHFKGNLYEVMFIAKNSETMEDMAVYKPLYDSEYKYWVRPCSMFNDILEVNGRKTLRFTPTEE